MSTAALSINTKNKAARAGAGLGASASGSQRRALTIAVALLVVVVLAVGGHILLAKRHTMLTEAASANAAAASASAQYRQGLRIKDHAGAYRAKLAAASAALPARRDQSGIIDEISAAAAKAGVTWSSASPSSAAASTSGAGASKAAGPAASAYVLSMQAKGSAIALRSFLSSLERLSRATSLTSVSLSESKGVESANISLTAYFLAGGGK